MMNRVRTTVQNIPSSVCLVAVTKTFPFAVIPPAYTEGIRHFAENRIDEARGKIEEAHKSGLNDITWHMIGHVQSRKVKEVVSLFDWVDSVDSIRLLEKLDRAAGSLRKHLHILLEVNVSGESSKFGFTPNEIVGAVEKGVKCHSLVLEGLMTMAPYVKNADENRAYFQSLRKLSETIRVQFPTFGTHLSMGTSCDYMVAIEESATQIRLGEALFGKREKVL